MTKVIKKLVGKHAKNTRTFSDFFHNASPSEKSKLIKEVIRESNKDQRKLMDEALRLSTQTR
jgi:predicted CopG family antitoxin